MTKNEEQKYEVFKRILEDLNYFNGDTNTRNNNQPKNITHNYGDTTVGEHN